MVNKLDLTIVSNLNQTAKQVGPLKDELKQVKALFEAITKQASITEATIKRALGGKNGPLGEGANSKTVLDLLRGGGPDARLANAGVKAQIDRARADIDQQFAALTNAFVRNMRQFTKAMQDQSILALRGVRQDGSLRDDLTALRQRQTAQAARVADAGFRAQQTGKAGDIAELRREEQALNNINTVVARVAELERQRAANLARVRKLQQDLQIAEATNDPKNALRIQIEQQRLRLKNEQIAAQRGEANEVQKHVGLLNQLLELQQQSQVRKEREKRTTADIVRDQIALNKAQAENAEFLSARATLAQRGAFVRLTGGDQTASRMLEVERERLRIVKALEKQQNLLQIAIDTENGKAKANLELKVQALRVEQEKFKLSQGQVNNYTAEAQKLKEMIALRQSLNQAEKASVTRAAPKSAQERIAQNTAYLNEAAKSQQLLEAAAGYARAASFERVAGDGGANLFKIQAQLAANFLIMSQFFNLIQFGRQFIVELDKAFFQLQAITATSNYEMVGLKKTLIEVSEQTKFTAVQVAEAATILGQAGFSAAQIKDAIGPITLFATATGTDLKQSVEIVTSSLSVFNMTAAETVRVANVLTEAINGTKLTTEKLGLGLQYAGQVAAESGAQFDELVALIGAFAQTGVRSGSTLGTGIRQLFVEFQKPSEKLTSALRTVGLGLTDVDVRSQGVLGVLQNLKEAGFDTATAFTALDVRAAQAYAAISSNLDIVERQMNAYTLSTAAAAANEIQVQSLSVKMERFASVLGVFINNAMGPLTEAFKVFLDVLTFATMSIADFAPAVSLAGVLIAGAFGGAAISRLLLFSRNLLGIGAAATTTAASVGILSRAMAFMGSASGIGVLVTGALFGTGFAIDKLNEKFPSLTKQIDTLRGKLSESKGRFDEYKERANSAAEAIASLSLKATRLNENQNELAIETNRLKERFGEWGLQLDENVTTVDQLIDALVRLKTTQQGFQLQELLSQVVPQQDLIRALTNRFNVGAITKAPDLSASDRRKLRSVGVAAVGEEALNRADQQKVTETTSTEELRRLADEQSRVLTSLNYAIDILARNPQKGLQELEAAARAQGISLGDISPEEADKFARQLLKAVQERAADLGQLLKAQTDRERREGQIKQTQFDRANAGISDRVSRDRTALTDIETRLDKGDKTTTEDGREVYKTIDIAAKRAIRDDIARKVEDIQKTIDGLIKQGAPPDSIVLGQLRELKGLYEKAGSVATEKIVSQLKVANEYTVAEAKARIRQLKANTTRFTPIETVIENMREAVATFEAQRAKELELKQEELRAAAKVRDVSEEEKKKALLEFDQETVEQGDALRQHFVGFVEKTADTLEKVADEFQSITPAVEEFVRRMKIELRALDEPFDAPKRQAELFKTPQFENKFSAVQQRDFNRANELREPLRFQRRIDFFDAKLPGLEEYKVEAEGQLELATARRKHVEEIRAAYFKGDRRLSQDQFEETTKTLTQMTEREKQLKNDIRGVETEILNIQEQRADAQQKLNDYAEVGAMQAMSLRQGAISAAEQVYQDIGGNQSMIVRLTDGMRSVFDASANSFSGLVKNIATGSESIVGSVKKMASGIIEAMLDIAANQIAIQIFGMIFGSFLGGGGAIAANGASTGSAIGGSTFAANPFSGMYQGGRVKRMAGGGRAGVPNRDSVLALLDPGEFVMRTTAAEAIGYDQLERMNADGNRVMAGSKGLAGAMQARETKPSVTNVWVAHKDEIPPPSPSDIVAIISSDIAKGGPTKMLIKSVMQGAM
jgi:TP901 family phage tail tape measure protein